MEYVCFINNRLARGSLDWRTPYERLHGYTPDISMIIRFAFWDKVYVKHVEARGGNFPSMGHEVEGRFVGFSETIGHALTYKVLTTDTKQVLYHSRLRLASDGPNPRADADAQRAEAERAEANEQVPGERDASADPTTIFDPGGDNNNDNNLPDLI